MPDDVDLSPLFSRISLGEITEQAAFFIDSDLSELFALMARQTRSVHNHDYRSRFDRNPLGFSADQLKLNWADWGTVSVGNVHAQLRFQTRTLCFRLYRSPRERLLRRKAVSKRQLLKLFALHLDAEFSQDNEHVEE
jgi:hypothetical protein